jgi:hypothetical protein
MVALAVRALGGVVTPSLARPLIQSANAAYLNGRPIEAAALLREAVRRYLAAKCASYALDAEGDAFTLFDRLTNAGAGLCFLYRDMLQDAEDVLSFRDSTAGKYFGNAIKLAFLLIESDNRGGA